MKLLARISLILLWVLIFLSLGYYIVFSNLGSILTADNADFSCRLIPAGVRLRLGDSVEVIKFKFPLQLIPGDDQWIVKTSRGLVSFSFAPRLQIRFKKTDLRRSSENNGE